MMNQQLTRKRFYASLYILATLVTAGLLAVAIWGKGVAAYPLYDDIMFNILGVFPPVFVGEYLLWRAVVYLFCSSERTARRTAFTLLYGLLGLGMLVFPFHPSVKLNVKWWLIGAYAALRGIDALVDITRAYVRIRSGGGKRGIAEFFFILIVLSTALFVILLGWSLWDFLFPEDWLSGFMLVFVVFWSPPLLLAVGLLRKGVLGLSDGTGRKVFPFLYGGIAVGIFVAGGGSGGGYLTGFSLPWVLVGVYGAVQAADTLLADVRVPRREGDKGCESG